MTSQLAPLVTIARAVGHLRFVVSGGEFICTGTLLNATSNNFAPLLLTANHCFSTQTAAQSLRVYWNYNTGDSPPSGTPFTDGANLLSTSTQSDFSFVRLTGSIPGGLQFMGWNGGAAAANIPIGGIHHPSGSHKRISYGTVSPLTTGCPGGIPSFCENFIRVTWNSGVTESGSSGSEIFYSEGGFQFLIGNLWGGGSSCSNPTAPDWYGRFSITYHKISTYIADAPCTYSISPSSRSFDGNGGGGSFSISTGSACYQSAIVTNPTTVQTFSNGSPIMIADRTSNSSPPGLGSLYPSTINVSGLSGVITRVRVNLSGVSHTFPDDLDFLLVAPNGRQVLLMSDSGGSTDINNASITIDQSGQNLLADDSTIFSGNYRPSNYAGNSSIDSGGTDNFPSPASGQNIYDNTLTFFNGISPNGVWRLYVVDDEAFDTGAINGGWSLELATTATSWLTITSGGSGYGNNTVNYSVSPNSAGQPARTGVISIAGQNHTVFQNASSTNNLNKPFDFDGDNKTDISIFRPSVGEWWYVRSSDGSNRAFQFGQSTDKIVPADYTGDGKTDIAFWRSSSGEWFILRSEDASFYSFPFGASGDIPAPADFDGDGKADPAIFRPSTATWYIIRSSDGGTMIQQFGANGDRPVAADYDGDGKTDLAIFRPSDGTWWINRSQSQTTIVFSFGTSTDKTVQADYTGDGKTDVAFWRPTTGEWFILRSEDSSFYSAPFGAIGDIPSPGDYDGDGIADVTVFRPTTGIWYINASTSGTQIVGFGATGDQPVPNAFVR